MATIDNSSVKDDCLPNADTTKLEGFDGLKIGIIAAMEEELSLLVEEIDCCTKVNFGQFTYYTGQVGETEGHTVSLWDRQSKCCCWRNSTDR